MDSARLLLAAIICGSQLNGDPVGAPSLKKEIPNRAPNSIWSLDSEQLDGLIWMLDNSSFVRNSANLKLSSSLRLYFMMKNVIRREEEKRFVVMEIQFEWTQRQEEGKEIE